MQTIDDILTNEKYLGHNVYGRGSVKLGQKHVVKAARLAASFIAR